MNKRKNVGKAAAAPGQTRAAEGERGNLALVRELARIANEFDLSEVEVQPSGAVRIARRVGGGAGLPAIAAAPAPAHAPSPSPHPAAAPTAASDEGGAFVTSPFVGTFYRAPSPEASPFADVGQLVRKGQVVCIIEAMKLMNEIESEADGKVAEVLVKNGDHVEYGQKLFRLVKA
jgi:acetyl-CoA carboxylase biotin carboxyl carrier protein